MQNANDIIKRVKYLDFLPPLILKVNEKIPWAKYIKGTVLFSDVSGFTPMSEKLSKFGAEGAENLTEVLNKYFSNMIEIINENGGEVMKFGGDAIHCFFPFEDSLNYATFSAISMQKEMEKYKKVKTLAGNFSLSMKIGISSGDVLIGTVGDELLRCEYIFAGKPVDLSAEAEHYAKAGEVIINIEEEKLPSNIKFEKVNENFYKALSIDFENKKLTKEKGEIKNLYINSYLIPEIYEIVSKGYEEQTGALLDVLTIFFQFSGFNYEKGKFDLKKFHEFFLKVIKITEKYNGRINRISMGDKGSTFLLLFGAPNSLERKEEIGCQFALEIKEMIEKEFPEIKFKIGMNSGSTFSGIVGGSGRLEYTVMGDSVNFSARLMQFAEDNQIILSKKIKEKSERIFEFDFLGERKFKGKEKLEEVYLLKKRKEEEEKELKEIKIYGREKETKEILNFLKKSSKGKPFAFFIEGEAGLGKTHLSNYIMKIAEKEKYKIYKEKGEITLRSHPHFAIKKLIEKILFEEKEKSEESLKNILKEADESFLKSLPFHLEFFGLSQEKTKISEEVKKKALNYQLSKVILKKAKDKKIFIFLDNLHWLDSLSIDLLLTLLQNFDKEKIFILISGREIPEREKFQNLKVCKFIKLKEIEKNDLKKILKDILLGEAKEILMDFIMKQTRGNPFYSISLINYLKEKNFIEEHLGEWTIKRGMDFKKEFTFDEIISSKISDLSIPEKIILRVSACIGSTFEKDLIKKVLKKEFDEKIFESLIEKGFIKSIEKDKFSFSYNLIQETIYKEVPEKLRKKNHKNIGNVMEKMFKDEIKKYFPNLSNHFYLGGVKGKALNYSLKAGDLLFEKYAYPEARYFYERAFYIFKNYLRDIKFESGLKYSKTLIRLGDLKKAIDILNSLIKNAKLKNKKEFLKQSEILKMEGMKRLSDFSYIERAKNFIKEEKDKKILNHIKCLLAEGLMRTGNLDGALNLFYEIIKEKGFSLKEDITSSYTFILGILTIQRKMDKAFAMYKEALQFAEREKDFYQIIKLKIAYSGILLQTGKIEEAINLLKELIDFVENFGDYYYLASIYLNIGKLLIGKGDYENCDKYLNAAKEKFEKIGGMEGLGEFYLEKGICAFYLKKYLESYNYYLKSLEIFESIGEKMEKLWIFYNLFEVCIYLNNKKEALKWYKKGLSSFKKEDNPKLYEMFISLKEKINNM